ncbi:MAG: 2,3-bisphosphoglycerate-dependent phosphoglycerate mutase [Candidatus Berkelbacteria bacterium Gr01-1014_85]|uniref:2,3-bisphosphoglycerate-dependent phosphoglycerate mutase n=1 Tax=Candidatus Berkelbacteria bacterium Gr01-1014_85 TaxID=2017150 RepID=A0A554JCK3_9BACT|nr:MAG: 2,3-bisphosphoglycerate-dependent phosphoglycerate mutase [Candidatus Berkelbacteria bacterium Gr01-1014_85]
MPSRNVNNSPGKAETSNHRTIYFVRHGQGLEIDTALDLDIRLDPPLSSLGLQQATQIAERLQKVQFDTLLSSPLRRARETTQIISKATDKQPEYSNLFVERIKPTELNGMPRIEKQASSLWQAWEESLYQTNLRLADGENYADLIARVDRAIEYLDLREEQTIVVVTHGFFLRAIIARILLGDQLSGTLLRTFLNNTSTNNTGLTAFSLSQEVTQARWKLLYFNDYSHLHAKLDSRL